MLSNNGYLPGISLEALLHIRDAALLRCDASARCLALASLRAMQLFLEGHLSL
jgi:hypothetical protein